MRITYFHLFFKNIPNRKIGISNKVLNENEHVIRYLLVQYKIIINVFIIHKIFEIFFS